MPNPFNAARAKVLAARNAEICRIAREEGMSAKEIAHLFDLDVTRIYQILSQEAVCDSKPSLPSTSPQS
jgi:hypothetical protein